MNPTRWWPTVIGITGYAGVGKDTAAQPFVGYERRSLADKVREFTEAMNPRLEDGELLSTWLQWHGWEGAKRRCPHVREALKAVGSSGRKVFGLDFWLRQTFAEPFDRLIIPDVRFVNEAAWLRDSHRLVVPDTVIFRVTRPGYEAESSFEREVDLIPVDFTVANDGSIEDLHFRVLDKFLDFITAGAHERTLSR